MSVLSDTSIRSAIDAEHLWIRPLGDGAIQPSSVDLRLGPIVLIPTPGQIADLDDTTLPERHNPINLKVGKMPLRPGDAVLGVTMEHVTLPTHLVGLLLGRSTIARLFVQVEAAGLLDPGYAGHPTLEIMNNGPHTVWLSAGMPIAQLMLLALDAPCESPYGSTSLGSRYQGDLFPTPARLPREASR